MPNLGAFPEFSSQDFHLRVIYVGFLPLDEAALEVL